MTRRSRHPAKTLLLLAAFGAAAWGVYRYWPALEHADLLGQRVALGLELLGAGLQSLAPLFERCEGHRVELHAAIGEGGGDVANLAAEKLDVEHVNLGPVESIAKAGFYRLAQARREQLADPIEQTNRKSDFVAETFFQPSTL